MSTVHQSLDLHCERNHSMEEFFGFGDTDGGGYVVVQIVTQSSDKTVKLPW